MNEVFFQDRDAMTRHLETHHRVTPATLKYECSLCLEQIHGGRDLISLHFARHMEEIALKVLPTGISSDDEGEDSDDSEQSNTHVDLTNRTDTAFENDRQEHDLIIPLDNAEPHGCSHTATDGRSTTAVLLSGSSHGTFHCSQCGEVSKCYSDHEYVFYPA